MGCHINMRSNRSKKRSVLKSNLGMSLIEVLIALGMVGILSSVIATVMAQMQKAQNQLNVLNTIENMRINIQKLAADGSAWRETVLDAANSGPGLTLACVQNNASCNHNADAALISSNETIDNGTLDNAPFGDLALLKTSNGGVYINGTSATSGYTDKGTPCTTWTATGNDECPIRWKMKIALECQGAATCLNPTIRLIAVLYYRSAGANAMKKIVNETKYRVDIRRGAKGDTRAERFTAEYRGAPAADGGPCSTGGVIIPLANTNPELNENANVSFGGGPPGTMRFSAGTYTCSASGTCFACGSVRLNLLVNGASLFQSSSMLAKDQQLVSPLINQVSFTVNATTPVTLVQTCIPGVDTPATAANFGLGMALPDYAVGSKFAEIQCTRIF